jgi:hypothetical protein
LVLDSLFIAIGEERTLSVRVLSAGGVEVPSSPDLVWRAENAEIALASDRGVVKGVASGETDVVVGLGGREDTVRVVVTPVASTVGSVRVDPSLSSHVRDAIHVIQTILGSAPLGASPRVPTDSDARSLALAVNRAGNVIFLSIIRGLDIEVGPSRTARDLLRVLLNPDITGIAPETDVVSIAEASPDFPRLVASILAAASTEGGFAKDADVLHALGDIVSFTMAAASVATASSSSLRIEGPCVGLGIPLEGIPLAAWAMPNADSRLCISNNSLLRWRLRLTPWAYVGTVEPRDVRTWEAVREANTSWTAVTGEIGSVTISAGQDFESNTANVSRMVLDLFGNVVSYLPLVGGVANNVVQCLTAQFLNVQYSFLDDVISASNAQDFVDRVYSFLSNAASSGLCFGHAASATTSAFLGRYVPVLGSIQLVLTRGPVWVQTVQYFGAEVRERGTACHTLDSKLFEFHCGALEVQISGDEGSAPLLFEVTVSRSDGWSSVPELLATGGRRLFENLGAVEHRVTVRPSRACAEDDQATLVPESRLVPLAPNSTSVVEFDGRCRTPVPVLTPGAIHFEVEEGDDAAEPQTIVISSSLQDPNVEISVGEVGYDGGARGWLLPPGLGGALPLASLTIGVDPRGLSQGVYTAHVPVTLALGPHSAVAQLAVSLEVSARRPLITLEPSIVSFTAQMGDASPAPAEVTISSSSSELLEGLSVGVLYGDANGWLSALPSTASAPGVLTLAPRTEDLVGGTYVASVVVTSDAVGNGPQVVEVTLTITENPEIGLSPSAVEFGASRGGADPIPQTVTVSNVGLGTLDDLSVEEVDYGNGPSGWLLVHSLSGSTAPASLSLAPRIAGLSEGTYSATVSVVSASAANSPQSVSVTLTVGPQADFSGSWSGNYRYGFASYEWSGSFTQNGSQVVGVFIDAGDCEWTMTGTADGLTLDLPLWTLSQPAQSVCYGVTDGSLRGTMSEDRLSISGTGVGIGGSPFEFELWRTP